MSTNEPPPWEKEKLGTATARRKADEGLALLPQERGRGKQGQEHVLH
jgi:hypothetical protein